MIQQSPSEERARAVLAKHTRGKDNIAAVENGGSCYHPTSEVVAAMIEFASQAAQPAEADGCVMVPRKIIAGLPHLPVGPSLSEEYWFGWTNAMQAARDHIGQHAAYTAATPKAPTATAADWFNGTEDCDGTPLTPPAPNDDLRAALERLEAANNAVAAATSPARYLTDLDKVQPALLELDEARAAARAALKENRRG